MFTLLRRLFWLGLLGGAGYAGWTIWQRRDAPTPAAAPEWPPLRTAAPADAAPADPPAEERAAPASAPTPEQDPPGRSRLWADPVDGACPAGYPIKANANSGIYHVPGGRFYDRTVPERCYADRADAEADGYRAAKA